METLTIEEGVIISVDNIGDFVNILTLDTKNGLEKALVFDYISRDFVGSRVRIESRAVHGGLFCLFPRFIDQDIYLGENPDPIKVRAYSEDVRRHLGKRY